MPEYATVVMREVDGAPEIVVVCHKCKEIGVLTVREAMRVAMNQFLDRHMQDQHGA